MDEVSESSCAALARQYRDASNLAARQRIYRFATGQATPWPSWVFEQLVGEMPDGAGRVLEVGCGNGILWRDAAGRVPATWDVVLSDMSGGMLGDARQALDRGVAGIAPDVRFRFVRADAQWLPFAGGTFDAAIANHMLYHVSDRDRAIAEFRRVLRPGGRLLAATNGGEHLRPMDQLLDRHVPPARADSLTAGAGTFLMENGAAQIARHFARVDARWRRGELHVTDAQAVVDYALSIGRAQPVLVGEKLAALRAEVEAEIAARGYFRLPTAAGMFVGYTDPATG